MENLETTIHPSGVQKPLYNSTGILVMGILSIVCFCCFFVGLIGIILGIIALILGNKALTEYDQNPQAYTMQSVKNAHAGRTCAIIGLSLGGIWIVGIITYLSFVGWVIGGLFSMFPWQHFSW